MTLSGTLLTILTLAEAVQTAQTRHPSMQQARAATTAADARRQEALSTFLPQLSGNATYQRATGNFAPRPGALPSSLSGSGSSSFKTFNYFNFGLTLSQNVWDFQSYDLYKAARASEESYEASERTSRVQVTQRVRLAYFQAQATVSAASTPSFGGERGRADWGAWRVR